jgi:7-cyano-7-deazaguanine synthase in queuosine biosynthesis
MLADFVPGRNTVAIDLAALLANAALDDAVASDCSSGPAEVSCAAPFHALGLDFAGVEATQGQRLFRVENSN